ncbi:serine hydrolase [Sphingosinicella terrae]|uniref:serine hydrolase n=1 Tax=Sphingosinicella terrae TaxID=2172047 RepID=UPI0013B46EF5|nr:serine hydrolase [Sphingosinicella terrae]
MVQRLLVWLAASLLASAAGSPASAQAPDPALQGRAEQLVALINGEAEIETMFSADFLAQVPAPQVRAVGEALRTQYGPARALARIDATSPTTATVLIDAERATIRLNLAIQPQAPHLIQGLLVAGAEVRGDSLAAIASEIAALPGETAFAVVRLGDGAGERLVGHRAEETLAIGSTFKLWILAEISRQVSAGERRWTDVVTLDRRSLPSGQLQDWPPGSPVTIHTLAALMISISDNTATDILHGLAGRGNVERIMSTIGVAEAARNRPFLSTLEAFSLKAASDAAYAAWRAADEEERRRLLAADYEATNPAGLAPGRFGTAPNRIEVEWFASAADLVRTMDWLRRNGDETTLAILAISSGLPPPLAAELAYVGYKGGSEPGVLNLTWLVRNRSGQWHVVTGSWNDPASALAEGRFAELMRRAVQLVR